MKTSPLKPLRSQDVLSRTKLQQLDRLSTQNLLISLLPGKTGALKTRADGTIMDGNHRIAVLRQRGVDVDALPREAVE